MMIIINLFSRLPVLRSFWPAIIPCFPMIELESNCEVKNIFKLFWLKFQNNPIKHHFSHQSFQEKKFQNRKILEKNILSSIGPNSRMCLFFCGMLPIHCQNGRIEVGKQKSILDYPWQWTLLKCSKNRKKSLNLKIFIQMKSKLVSIEHIGYQLIEMIFYL